MRDMGHGENGREYAFFRDPSVTTCDGALMVLAEWVVGHTKDDEEDGGEELGWESVYERQRGIAGTACGEEIRLALEVR